MYTIFVVIVYPFLILAFMKMRKGDSKDVIYPVRIPREIFMRAKAIATSLDLSTCQLIRAALREKIANADNLPRQENRQ